MRIHLRSPRPASGQVRHRVASARIALAVLTLCIAGCGGDRITNEKHTITGTWVGMAEGLCDILAHPLCVFRLHLTQTGDSLAGTIENIPESECPLTLRGWARGDSISFSWDPCVSVGFWGRVDGDLLTGRCTYLPGDGGPPYAGGGWIASRESGPAESERPSCIWDGVARAVPMYGDSLDLPFTLATIVAGDSILGTFEPLGLQQQVLEEGRIRDGWLSFRPGRLGLRFRAPLDAESLLGRWTTVRGDSEEGGSTWVARRRR